MKNYRLTTQSDSGKFTFRIYADSLETAKLILMKSEGCPECAIIKIKEDKPKTYKHTWKH